MCLNQAGMWFLAERMHVHYLAAKACTTVVVFFWNFGARKVAVFGDDSETTRGTLFSMSESTARLLSRVAMPTVAVYFLLASLALAYTKLPFVDEGTFIASATNIATTGHTGDPCLQPWGLGIPLPEARTFNFWVMPGFLYTLAAWFRLFPATIFSARMATILFGGIALVLFYLFVRELSTGWLTPALSTLFLAVDFNWITRSTTARMDTVCVLLNILSWLSYLWLRKRSLPAAIGASFAIGSTNLLFHPNGIFAFAGVAVLWFLLDRKITRKTFLAGVAGATIPLLALIPWAMAAPEVWKVQVLSHSQGRFLAFLNPLEAIKLEFLIRYYASFGGPNPFALTAGVILLGVLVAYVWALVVGVLSWKTGGVLTQFAVGTAAIIMIYFTFFEAGHFRPYNAHLLPLFCILLTTGLLRLAASGWRKSAIALGCLVIFTNAMATAAYVRDDRYHKSYQPLVNLLKANMGPNDLLLSYAYFGIPLGYNRVTEDYTLVEILRHHPKFVTLNQHFQRGGVLKAWLSGPDPADFGMISRDEKTRATSYLDQHYKLVLSNRDYNLFQLLQ
jgi:4-amino-4-deoxy-L-arabinose transferase-like glycosyltransferase